MASPAGGRGQAEGGAVSQCQSGASRVEDMRLELGDVEGVARRAART